MLFNETSESNVSRTQGGEKVPKIDFQNSRHSTFQVICCTLWLKLLFGRAERPLKQHVTSSQMLLPCFFSWFFKSMHAFQRMPPDKLNSSPIQLSWIPNTIHSHVWFQSGISPPLSAKLSAPSLSFSVSLFFFPSLPNLRRHFTSNPERRGERDHRVESKKDRTRGKR